MKALRLAFASLMLVTGALYVHVSTPAIHAAVPATTNCFGYRAGMYGVQYGAQLLANDAPGMKAAAATTRLHGLRTDMRAVLRANGKPIDNYKVIRLFRDAFYAIGMEVDATVRLPKTNAYAQWQARVTRDLGYVGVLLREICLPSKSVRLPCTGSCVLNVAGSGRFLPFRRTLSFITPPDYVVKYSYDCSAAYNRGIAVGFPLYDSADLSYLAPGDIVVADARGKGTGSVVRDLGIPHRILLFIVVEQACQWHLEVTKQ